MSSPLRSFTVLGHFTNDFRDAFAQLWRLPQGRGDKLLASLMKKFGNVCGGVFPKGDVEVSCKASTVKSSNVEPTIREVFMLTIFGSLVLVLVAFLVREWPIVRRCT